jgi:hypothetical protein
VVFVLFLYKVWVFLNMDEFDQFLGHYRENEYNLARAPKRYLRDPGNLLEAFDDDQFFRRYRYVK